MTFAEAISASGEACAASLSFDAAQAIIAANAVPLGIERVPLSKAGRRVLAEPVHAQIDSPRYDAAAMDGFAVRAQDVAAGRRRFRVVGRSYPGEPWAGDLGLAQAVRIMTGAAMPGGASCVLVREAVAETGDGIEMMQAPPARLHVRARASDMAAGDLVLPAQRVLDARALLVAAAADVGQVAVWRRPRVRMLASGDELIEPGSARATADRLPDSLSEALLLIVRQYGALPLGATRVPDAGAAIAAAAAAALDDCDVLVVSGGASRGDRDFSRLGLAPLGLQLGFADVAIKPGKPAWYGRIGACHVLGLPGNPTAALTIARLFLMPLLAALGGRGFAAGLGWTQAPLLAAVPETGSRETFLCAEWCDRGVRVIERQSASAQLMLAHANALVRRPTGGPALVAGDCVPVLRF